MSNLATVLATAAGRHPQRPVVRADDKVLTCADLDDLSAQVAGGLLAHGVRPGDLVGLRVPDVPAFPVLYFGALRTGAVVVLLHPRRRPRPRPQPQLRPRPRLRPSAVRSRGARLVFAAPETRHAEEATASGTTVVQVGPDFLDQVAFWPRHPRVAHRDDDDPAVLIDAEDTAARSPGGSTLTHGALRAYTALTVRALSDEASAEGLLDRTPTVCPSGRAHGLDAALLTGARLPVEPTEPAPPLPSLLALSSGSVR